MNYKRGETPAVWKVFRWIRPLISLFSNIAEDFKPRELILPLKNKSAHCCSVDNAPSLPVDCAKKKKRGKRSYCITVCKKKNLFPVPLTGHHDSTKFKKRWQWQKTGKKKQRKEQKTKKTNKQTLCFTCFLKGLRGGYSFSEVEKGTSQWNDRNRKGKKKKKHSISWIEIYLSPEANLLLAGYIWTGFSYLPFDSAQCRCCL